VHFCFIAILPRFLRVRFRHRGPKTPLAQTPFRSSLAGAVLRSSFFQSLLTSPSLRSSCAGERGVGFGRLRVLAFHARSAGASCHRGLVNARHPCRPLAQCSIQKLAASCEDCDDTCRRFALLVHKPKWGWSHPAEERRGHPAHQRKRPTCGGS